MRHLFGTDKDGLDIFSRVLYAPQIDLSISLTSTLISAVLGTPMGAMAGYFSGRRGLAGLLADWTMRAVDMTLAFPVFVLALLLVGTLGAQIFNVVLALVFVNAPVFVWLTRSEVLGMRQRQFVEAARCSGNSELRVVLSHVIPNSISSSLTQVSVMLGYGILLTAGLSFIGAGVRVPTPEWGLMISQGATDMITGQWWPALFPGLALGSAVLGFSLAGDGLRGYLNPKTRTVQIRGR
jgi:peptide/nickel transport system permease protein